MAAGPSAQQPPAVLELDFSDGPLLPSAVARKPAQRNIPFYLLYGEKPQRDGGPLLHIETIEARSARHHWKIDPHRHHALHQLIFVLQGRGVVLAEGTRAQYRPPAVALIPAGSVHGFEFEPGTRGHVVSIADELLREMQQREAGIAALFAHPATLEFSAATLRDTDAARSIRKLARETTGGSALATHGWLQILLASLLRLAREQPGATDAAAGQRRQLVTRFSELVEQRFRSAQSVADYAKLLHVSDSRLRNACLATTGQSPIQLIHARLLIEAKRQLHYTDSPVSTVAYALGFQDPAYFTRFFSRRTGLSPRAFRVKGPELAQAAHSSTR